MFCDYVKDLENYKIFIKELGRRIENDKIHDFIMKIVELDLEKNTIKDLKVNNEELFIEFFDDGKKVMNFICKSINIKMNINRAASNIQILINYGERLSLSINLDTKYDYKKSSDNHYKKIQIINVKYNEVGLESYYYFYNDALKYINNSGYLSFAYDSDNIEAFINDGMIYLSKTKLGTRDTICQSFKTFDFGGYIDYKNYGENYFNLDGFSNLKTICGKNYNSEEDSIAFDRHKKFYSSTYPYLKELCDEYEQKLFNSKNSEKKLAKINNETK